MDLCQSLSKFMDYKLTKTVLIQVYKSMFYSVEEILFSEIVQQ